MIQKNNITNTKRNTLQQKNRQNIRHEDDILELLIVIIIDKHIFTGVLTSIESCPYQNICGNEPSIAVTFLRQNLSQSK